jgi:hypothetical protein
MDRETEWWNTIYEAFRRHRKKEDQESIQAALDRIATKCLRKYEDKYAARSLNQDNCDVDEKTLSPDDLTNLKTFHERQAPAKHFQDKEPIIVVDCDGILVVIDGNNRVNKWLKDSPKRTRQAIIIKPRQRGVETLSPDLPYGTRIFKG